MQHSEKLLHQVVKWWRIFRKVVDALIFLDIIEKIIYC